MQDVSPSQSSSSGGTERDLFDPPLTLHPPTSSPVTPHVEEAAGNLRNSFSSRLRAPHFQENNSRGDDNFDDDDDDFVNPSPLSRSHRGRRDTLNTGDTNAERGHRFSEVLRVNIQDRSGKKERSNARLVRRVLRGRNRRQIEEGIISEVIRIIYDRRWRIGGSAAAKRSRLSQGWTSVRYLRSRMPARDPVEVDNAVDELQQRKVLEVSHEPGETAFRSSGALVSAPPDALRRAAGVVHLLLLPTLKALYRMIPGHRRGKHAPARKADYVTSVSAYMASGPENPHPDFLQRMVDPDEPHGMRVAAAALMQTGPCVRFVQSVRRGLRRRSP